MLNIWLDPIFNISHPSLDEINRLMNKATEWPQWGCPHLTQNQISVLTIAKALSILMEVTQSFGPLKTQQTHLKVISLQAAKGTLDQLWMGSTGWHKRQLSQAGVWRWNLAVWSALHSWRRKQRSQANCSKLAVWSLLTIKYLPAETK